MGRASGVGARCWGTPVEFGCLLTYRQLISGCRAVRNLSPTGALFLFHDVRLYDPERRLVRGSPRKGLGMCRRVTNKGESGFGIANDRGTVAVEWKHHRCDRLKRRRDLSVEVSVLRGWDPKVPVGSPVSFPKRSNPAWRLVAPSSPCRINTKSKHQASPPRLNASSSRFLSLSLSMKCKGVGSLIQTLRGFCQALEEDASWCEEEERVLGVRMPWGAP